MRVGLLGVAGPPPGLVVAGVNAGANMGDDVTYSGTVGAALEGALRGLPAVAVSVECAGAGVASARRSRWSAASSRTSSRAGCRAAPSSTSTCPTGRWRASQACGPRAWGAPASTTASSSCLDGDASCVQEYFLTGDRRRPADVGGTDFEVVAQGYVSLTPLRFDLLDGSGSAQGLRDWDLDLEALRA